MSESGDARRRPAWWLAALSALAALISAYLAGVAWTEQGLPLGCADDGGCAQVLRSRWSGLWGLPVSSLAVLVYSAVALAATRPMSRWSPGVLGFAAVALVTAAAWFLLIQAVFLHAFCVWCVVEHLLGLVVSGMSIRQALTWNDTKSPDLGRGCLLGGLGILMLMALQVAQDPNATTRRLNDTGAADTTAGSEVALLDGRLRIDPAREPRLGDPKAEHTMYLLFDYCCPHCRRIHGHLREAIAKYPRQLSLVCLPMPRDRDCNDAIEQTETRFEHACELARLALAVWHADPSAYGEFDRWLFEPSSPPAPEVAWDRAAALVSGSTLRALMLDPVIADAIHRNVTAFNDSRVGYLPVIMSPGMNTIVGRPESKDALLAVLETTLLKRIDDTEPQP